jgi:acyl-CoA reductase-like NAD-dependent aldehyde dehydrogenase
VADGVREGAVTLPEAGRVQDRDVQYAIYAAHEFFDKGPYRKMMEYRSMVEQARDNLDAQKDRYTPAQIAEKRRKYEVDLRGIQSQMIPVIEIFEKTMATGRTGAVFQRHGLEPRLENVPALIEAYKRKAPRS